MCVVYAIISFDFRLPVAIHLLRSHIAVSDGGAMWENEKSNSLIKMPSYRQTRAFFLPVPHHPNQPCRCKRQTSYASMLDRVAAPLWGGVVCFSRGEAFSFLLFRFLLDLFLFSVFSFKAIQFLVVHSGQECRCPTSQQQTA